MNCRGEDGWYNCYNGSTFLGQDYFHDGIFQHKDVTHWLTPPITGYFLTPEEMEEVIRKTWEAGYNRGADEVNVLKPEGHIFPDFKNYILNLLNKQP